ncbi:MAG TPA: helix-turn-helix domain-containing protein [Trebonia sp.]
MRAAGEVFAASGVDVSLEGIARHAGVGAATLYRHFASKDDLVRAVLELAFAEQVEPVLQGALDGDGDAGGDLVRVIEAALQMATANRNALAAVKGPQRIPLDLAPSFFQRLAGVLTRAQRQGAVRGDLRAADLPRLVAMLITAMWFDESGNEWRRYLSLFQDALAPAASSPLPPLGAAAGTGFASGSGFSCP